MSVDFTKTVAILEEDKLIDSVPSRRRNNMQTTRHAVSVVADSLLAHLLKSLQMKGEHWRGRGDQHLLQGIGVDILLGSYTENK